MEKNKNSSLWTEEGYNIFAHEGMEGIQVERVARILQLNKSGFYHYFGDFEGFCMELLKLHEKKVNLFLEGVREVKILDPDYLLLVIEHAPMIMFQVQLTRNKDRNSFYKTSELMDQRFNHAVRQLWGDYLGIHSDSDLAIRYYNIVRDKFYTRISFQNLNYQFLHDLIADAKHLIDQIGHLQSPLRQTSYHVNS